MAIKFLQDIEVDGEVQGTSLDINGIANISSTLTLEGTTDQILILKSTDDGAVYHSYYRGSDRHAYVGFGGSGDTFNIANEESGGAITLATASTTALTLNSSQNATFAGTISSGSITTTGHLQVSSSYPRIYLTDTDTNDDYSIINNNGTFIVYNDTDSSTPLAISGTNGTTLNGTLTVGADDTGHDVIFYGATSGKKTQWDESANTLIVDGTLDVNGNADISGNLVITGSILNNVENNHLDIYGGNDTTNDAHIKLHGNANNYGSIEMNYGYDSTNSYFKVKQGSTENFKLQGGNATFAGDVTVSGGDVTINSSSAESELFLNGTGNGYVNAAVILECQDDNGHSRGAGVYMNNVVGETEWFAGRPYSVGDSYQILRRHTTSGNHNNSTASTGTSNTSALLAVDNAGKLTIADDLVIKHDGTIGGANDTDLLQFGNGTLTVNGNGSVTGDLVVTGQITNAGNTLVEQGSPKLILKDSTDNDDQSIIFRNSSDNDDYKIATADFTSGGGGDGFYIGSTIGSEVALVTNNTTALTIDSSQNTTFAGNVIFSGTDVTMTGNIIHASDTNTYFGFHANDSWRVVTGGSERLEVTDSGMKLGNTGATVTQILDEDNMASNSATSLATQQSIKAYIDGKTPDASDQDKGLIKVAATEASVVPQNISTTSARSYQIQTDENGVATVNVPWTDTTTDSTKLPLAGGTLTGNIAHASNFTLDVGGDITLDADGDDIFFAAGGTNIGKFTNDSSNFLIRSLVQDKDIVFKGDDAGSTITALTLDMSNAGKATFNNDVVAFSDRKLKDNIETLDGKKVLDMRGVSFTRKDTGLPGSGVIAQEIQKVAPELVNETNGTLGVSYGNLVGYLIEAIKDQQKQIDELKELCNGCSK